MTVKIIKELAIIQEISDKNKSTECLESYANEHPGEQRL